VDHAESSATEIDIEKGVKGVKFAPKIGVETGRSGRAKQGKEKCVENAYFDKNEMHSSIPSFLHSFEPHPDFLFGH
jgi:hypothetical protein